jgi:hypothetical protein
VWRKGATFRGARLIQDPNADSLERTYSNYDYNKAMCTLLSHWQLAGSRGHAGYNGQLAFTTVIPAYSPNYLPFLSPKEVTALLASSILRSSLLRYSSVSRTCRKVALVVIRAKLEVTCIPRCSQCTRRIGQGTAVRTHQLAELCVLSAYDSRDITVEEHGSKQRKTLPIRVHPLKPPDCNPRHIRVRICIHVITHSM